MREKIGQFARGIFEYSSPDIVLSDESISADVEKGSCYYGSISISNKDNSVIKGVIYSSNDMVITETGSFCGKNNEIKYCVRSGECMTGETVKGNFIIVSNCGEIEVPYIFTIKKPVFMTSMGEVKDLFQFANLAKSDEAEALRLFSSPQFENTFLAKDVKYSLVYKSLMKGSNINVAMEEFLVAVHKKSPVNISVDKRKMEYVVTNEQFRDKITITKDTWGYCDVTVRSESSSIVPVKSRITSDDFIGNSAQVEFIVSPDVIKTGKSYGRIVLESIGNKINVDIICSKSSTPTPDVGNNRLKSFVCKYMKNYIAFRTEKISLDKYVSDSEVLISNMCILTSSSINDLLKIHLMAISGRTARAIELLEIFKENLENISKVNPLDYCGYLYLTNLINKDGVELENAVEKTRSYYESSEHTWQMLWLLLYMDKKYDNNIRVMYKDIKEQFELGCNTPVMYYEACSMFNQDTLLIEKMGKFEIQVIAWGAKNDAISEELAIVAAKECSKLKEYNNLVFRTLVRLYEKYKDDEILTAICVQLIKGQKTGEKYFKWYKEGVERQLKITQLHEHYMYSYNEESREPLPASLLLYFSYNSGLSDKKKAFLYSSIIKNKTYNYPTYKNYRKIIEKFMRKQIKSHIINENLKVIYEEFLSEDIIDEEIAKDLPYIMFRYDISCYNPDFKGVIVVNRMVESEIFTPFVDGRAQINLYTDDCEIFLVDKNDNRYVRSNSYTIKKLLNSEMFVDKCYEMNSSNEMLILHIAQQIDSMSRADFFNVAARKKLLEISDLRKEYERKCQYNLIQYCHDNKEIELLDAYLNQTEIDHLTPRERSYVVEYLIIRGFYLKAVEAVDKYGFGIVPAKRIQKLALNLIGTDFENDKTRNLLCEMCIHVFKQGRCEDELLEYMVKNFNGSTKDMFSIWRECKEKDIECTLFEERLLGQVLFAESYTKDIAALFSSYYEKGNDKRLIKAFLKYNAYKYLIRDRVISPEIFDIMSKELVLDKNEMCSLALLKYYSTKDELEKGERVFAEFYMKYFSSKGIVLGFFKDFNGKVRLPESIADKYYVEYKADPDINVSIHYGIDDTGNFVEEKMKDVFMGIRVKEFMLFYGENLQYYISEESASGAKITESFNISATTKSEDDNSLYSMINTILMAKEMEDENTVIDTMKEIAKNNYLIDNLFKPIYN